MITKKDRKQIKQENEDIDLIIALNKLVKGKQKENEILKKIVDNFEK